MEIGIVIELKYAGNTSFDSACKEALKQIKDRNYEETLVDDGMKTIYRYEIACYKIDKIPVGEDLDPGFLFMKKTSICKKFSGIISKKP